MSHYDEERKADKWVEIKKADEIIRDFVSAYEKEKYRIIVEGGSLPSVYKFAASYIPKLKK